MQRTQLFETIERCNPDAHEQKFVVTHLCGLTDLHVEPLLHVYAEVAAPCHIFEKYILLKGPENVAYMFMRSSACT